MDFNFYQLYWIFIAYAIIGWCTEVAYTTFKTGTFVNRGFLNGPVCPIYGFGVVIVTVLLTPIRSNFLILFIGAIVLTSVLEFLTGYILEKFFHRKWWDYSDMKFNINGYICLRFSVLWGIGCVAVMYVIQPPILLFIAVLPKLLGLILLILMTALFATDLSVTIITICKMTAQFKRLTETEQKFRKLSDELGEGISKRVEAGMQFYEKHTGELELLKEKFESILNEKHLGTARLIKAFPNLNAVVKEREFQIKEQVKTVISKITRN